MLFRSPVSNKRSFLEVNSFDEFYSIISSDYYDNLSKYLPEIFTGFSQVFISNVLDEIGIDSDSKDVNELEELYTYIKNLINQFGSSNVLLKTLKKDYTIELGSFDITLSKFLDDYYRQKEIDDIFVNAKSSLSKLILTSLKKSSKKLENINQKDRKSVV